jgi:hypothetical protein
MVDAIAQASRLMAKQFARPARSLPSRWSTVSDEAWARLSISLSLRSSAPPDAREEEHAAATEQALDHEPSEERGRPVIGVVGAGKARLQSDLAAVLPRDRRRETVLVDAGGNRLGLRVVAVLQDLLDRHVVARIAGRPGLQSPDEG